MVGSPACPRVKRTSSPCCQVAEPPTGRSRRATGSRASPVSGCRPAAGAAPPPAGMRTSRCPARASREETFMPCRRITSARNFSSRLGLSASRSSRSTLSTRRRTVGPRVRAEAIRRALLSSPSRRRTRPPPAAPAPAGACPWRPGTPSPNPDAPGRRRRPGRPPGTAPSGPEAASRATPVSRARSSSSRSWNSETDRRNSLSDRPPQPTCHDAAGAGPASHGVRENSSYRGTERRVQGGSA